MNHYVGIDMSLEASSLWVIDAIGKIAREGKVASEPDALIAWLRGLKLELTRIGLEAGPLSQWLYAAMRPAALAGLWRNAGPSHGGRIDADWTAAFSGRADGSHATPGSTAQQHRYLPYRATIWIRNVSHLDCVADRPPSQTH